jgi:hypothetical protein
MGTAMGSGSAPWAQVENIEITGRLIVIGRKTRAQQGDDLSKIRLA